MRRKLVMTFFLPVSLFETYAANPVPPPPGSRRLCSKIAQMVAGLYSFPNESKMFHSATVQEKYLVTIASTKALFHSTTFSTFSIPQNDVLPIIKL